MDRHATDPAARQFLTIAEIGGDIAWVIDLPAAVLRYVSPGIAQFSGYTAAEWCDPASAAAPVLAGLMAGLPARLARLDAGDASRARLVRETGIVHRQGHKVPLEIISTFTVDAAGVPDALVGVIRDIAQRREHEAGRRRFASMLNHEFRTPLSTIDGAIQRLEVTGIDADQATRDRYRKIAKAVDQMIGMLEQYLSPDIVAASGTVARADRVNPRRLLEEGAQQVRASGRPATLALGDLPDTLRGEPQGLRLALKVLVDNALQYGPPGQPIALVGSVSDSALVLAVHDSGAGVPDGEQDAIFGKHVRGSNVGQHAGAGLGLYMARAVVEVHGGTIEHRRRAADGGPGTTEFRICLPIRSVTGKEVATVGHSSDNSGNKF
ncbi:ATP-binding protein [Massilia sp. DWR3-1-1]|uniref:PAS domain-containing sensor histidine kinase n=1 Tax=Massilia sp. DWR3-1-1 TaxID=2804559 RepID=UPI003CEF7E4C